MLNRMLLKTFASAIVLAIGSSCSWADWAVEITTISTDSSPWIEQYTQGSGTATASTSTSLDIFPTRLYIQAQFATSATQGYNSGYGQAIHKVHAAWSWTGGGTPSSITVTRNKTWALVGYSVYASGVFDGVLVTSSSGTTGSTTAYTLTNNFETDISCSTYGGSGYQYGGTFSPHSGQVNYDWNLGF